MFSPKEVPFGGSGVHVTLTVGVVPKNPPKVGVVRAFPAKLGYHTTFNISVSVRDIFTKLDRFVQIIMRTATVGSKVNFSAIQDGGSRQGEISYSVITQTFSIGF